MIIKYGEGSTKHGPGVDIWLDGNEVAKAISAYLVAHGVVVSGPRTTRDKRQPEDEATPTFRVYVDPSGFVIDNGEKFDGRGAPNPDVILARFVADLASGASVSATGSSASCGLCGAEWVDDGQGSWSATVRAKWHADNHQRNLGDPDAGSGSVGWDEHDNRSFTT